MKNPRVKKILIIVGVLAVLGLIGYYVWDSLQDNGPGKGFAGGNGRIEATEIDIATKLAGRVEEIRVDEGDFVEAGQILAIMQTDVLQAQLAEAKAQYQQALTSEASAKAQISLRESDKLAAQATVTQRESELDSIQRRLDRTVVLTKRAVVADQQYDDEVTSMHGAKAAVASAEAQVAVAEAALQTAKAEAVGAQATVKAAQATIDKIEADIKDSTLVAPRSGRIQYRIAQPGEVLGVGGKVLNLVDLSDVYMTFFLPATETGAVRYGSEARIILDAAPDYPVPATITYVASTAQFTPKTVETASEREKLMFRIKAQIDRSLLRKHLEYVKTGLPGMAWVKIDPEAQWPESFAVKSGDK
ncbi:hemolysin D [Deltaproteobacteria bacterium Smac51]|nr:hemolysin D [Deltaproteobacteria bacterium Smac51]